MYRRSFKCIEIENYGKILNANRSYYLTRTQPPFYTSLIREVYEVTKDREWLKYHLQTAIKEYETVWMVQDKRLTKNGLNRFLADRQMTPQVSLLPLPNCAQQRPHIH